MASCKFSCVLLPDEFKLGQVLSSTESQQTNKNHLDSQNFLCVRIVDMRLFSTFARNS